MFAIHSFRDKQMMGCVIMDLMGCTFRGPLSKQSAIPSELEAKSSLGCIGTEPPYVMVSRATSLDELMVLCDFDAKQISRRRSEDLRKEFARFALLK